MLLVGAPTPLTGLAWVSAATLCIIIAANFMVSRIRSRGLPPSPGRSDPFIGHVRMVPLDYQWATFASWGKKLGEILYIHIPGRQIVILNSFAAARDLMDRKGANNSDRPRLITQTLLGWGNTLVLLRYGDRWRKQRRIIQRYFDQQASLSFRDVALAEADHFVRNVYKTSEDLERHIHRLASGAIAMISYGHRVTTDDDMLLDLVRRAASASVAAGNPGTAILDFLPFLRFVPAWFPGAKFKRLIVAGRTLLDAAFEMPYETVKKDRALGTANPSFMLSALEESNGGFNHEEDLKALGGVIFLAGAETTESTLHTFFLLMLLHPDVARRAQSEIDSVIGGAATRFPTWEDRENLPYVDAILKETYRFQPAVPLGVPHASIKPDTYNGKSIPGGSMLVPNIWQMMRDERYYPEPEKFLPDRFMQSREAGGGSKKLDDAAADPTKIVFGFGRRICPGRFFADQMLWLTMAMVLSAFDILPAVDGATGREVLPLMEFTSGSTTRPKPFRCRIIPRSKRHAVAVRDE